MNVLCLVELDEGGVSDASLRALTFARSLATGGPPDPGRPDAAPGPGVSGGPGPVLAAVAFGPAGRVPAGLLGRYGVTEAYVVEPAALDGYAPQAWARTLEGLLGVTLAAAVVAAGTDCGSEVLAHLAAMTSQPMAANCITAVPAADGSLAVSRQRWAGLLIEDAALEGMPAVLTVATDTVPPEPVTDTADPPPVYVHEPDLNPADLQVRAVVSAGGDGGASLATARVVVGGGRGVGGPDGFAPLEELASLLGGVVGVSRVVTSEGWRPHTQQVGQTGTKITPELYLACGISGAIQHMAGCASARHIVVINTDPSAPILSRADYAVIGDLAEVIPALVAALKERA